MSPSHPFQNPDLPVEQRVEDLVSRLTLVEKVGQLMHENPAVDRLDVPAYNWWNEACHGVGRAGRATVFPQVIGLAATWNRALVREVATKISDEARAKHHEALSRGKRGQYQGLTFWTPNINIFRDPRWGRGQETFGEDPYLTAELGVEMVKGLQGDDPRYLKVAACAKHYAVHSGPEQERHEFDARPTQKDLYETYLPAFERLVRAGVEAVMGAYNRTLGEACCASSLLIGDILRGRWGFKGHYVSDCGAVDDFHNFHKVTRDGAASAALAVRRGCDLNCGCTYNELVAAVQQGLITEAEIDVSLRRLLTTKFRLGLFDPADRVPWSKLPLSVVDSPAHRALARRAAAESVVLLKNNDAILPLPRECERLLVVGPTAANYGALLGNYHGVCPEMVTIFQGILEALPNNTPVKYRPGCPLLSPQAPGVNYTMGAAQAADVVIAVMGLDHTIEGEEGDSVASPSGGDRDVIELPKVQMDFLREVRKVSKKLVLVLTGGSAIAASEAHDLADAVVKVWYPGCEGGRAVADVLFGAVSPSGKMPVTVPHKTADLPEFRDYAMRGRTYKFAEIEPLYPFGFGLSYTTLRYGPLALDTTRLADGASVTVRTTLTNTGAVATDEVVQCYVVPPQSFPNAPRAVLAGFHKVRVPAGATAAVEFQLSHESFRQFDAQGQRVVVPGRHGVVIGSCSPGPRGRALGAPAPAEGSVEIA
ncbi:MAG: glycoside hydrolase family 3 C-terminal domain-containing protein [Opitutaceae bacterium]|nr:glycoside hydrolase family 3 C-terminal domain-containing protein [Opitutaceae bacterium]